MKPKTEFLRLPHFFLFKDLFYSHLEAKKILKEISEGEQSFGKDRVEALSKHYLVLFEVLEFLHEYTPDFFVINKINDTASEIVCFANEEFSKTFKLKSDPEGRDILKLMTKQEEQVLRDFVDKEIQKAKKQLRSSQKGKEDISVQSNSIELPVAAFGKHRQKLYEIHVRLTGVVEKQNEEILFDGYSIILGRDVTDSAIQKEIAESFTNIPESLHEKFEEEAYKRKVLQEKGQTITLKNTFVLTGFSDISNSAKWRYEAMQEDEKNKNHEKTKEVNTKTEAINHFLHAMWEEAKKRINKIHPAVFLLEETDGLDYSVCFPEKNNEQVTREVFQKLRREELLILSEIARSCVKEEFPLKHIIVAHDKRVDFYFEEKFENRFKIATHNVDAFIKKKRLEKACEEGSSKRIVQEGCVTVAFDSDEDRAFYLHLFKEFVNDRIFEGFEEGQVESLPGLGTIAFLRAKVVNKEQSFYI